MPFIGSSAVRSPRKSTAENEMRLLVAKGCVSIIRYNSLVLCGKITEEEHGGKLDAITSRQRLCVYNSLIFAVSLTFPNQWLCKTSQPVALVSNLEKSRKNAGDRAEKPKESARALQGGSEVPPSTGTVVRFPRVGGLINHYERVA